MEYKMINKTPIYLIASIIVALFALYFSFQFFNEPRLSRDAPLKMKLFIGIVLLAAVISLVCSAKWMFALY